MKMLISIDLRVLDSPNQVRGGGAAQGPWRFRGPLENGFLGSLPHASADRTSVRLGAPRRTVS